MQQYTVIHSDPSSNVEVRECDQVALDKIGFLKTSYGKNRVMVI